MIEIKNINGNMIKKIERDTLKEADLRWADLSGADLRKANLEGANLRKANLEGADLSGADLRYVNLEGADLSGADLSKTNLERANLSGANLLRAKLWRADLSGADLRYANLEEANLERADLRGANLWKVRGISVTQQTGSKDSLIFIKYGKNLEKKQLQIGCLIHPLEYWLENYKKIGLGYNYSEEEIQEYGEYIQEF